MKILLINPPYRFAKELFIRYMPPLGLLYLVSAIKNSCDVDVRIYDALIADPKNIREIENDFQEVGASYEAIKKEIEEGVDVVGISCMFSPNWPVVAKIARIAKEANREIKIILGSFFR